MSDPLKQLADELTEPSDFPITGLMAQAREALNRSSNQLEDLAREIADDERALQEKKQRFSSICGEISEMPNRIQQGAA